MRCPVILSLSLLMVAACNEKRAPAPVKSPPAAAPAPAADEGRGAIEVTVRFEGTPPKMGLQDRSHDRYCRLSRTKDETVLVAKDGTLRNVIVRISKGIDETIEPPEEPVVIDQTKCMFRPRVSVAIENQKVHLLNSDKTMHNVHGFRGQPPRTIFNLAQIDGGKPIEKKFLDGGEIISLRCDVHPWMASYIAISTHPYWALIRDTGPARIENVPTGKKTVETWHEVYGFESIEVDVRAGQMTKATITYRPNDTTE
ncbi:MAG: hypothetical protein V3T05_12720 [Myxococcota bacterium]